MAATGIAGPSYGGAMGYQFRLVGRHVDRELIAAADEAFTVEGEVQLVSALIHRRMYLGWAAAPRGDDPTALLFLRLSGQVEFLREGRTVGEVPVLWSNETSQQLGNYGPRLLPNLAPPFATEIIPGVAGGGTNIPPHAVTECGGNVLQVVLPNLVPNPGIVIPVDGAIIRMWPYSFTAEADAARVRLDGAYRLDTISGNNGHFRAYLGVHSQDHPF